MALQSGDLDICSGHYTDAIAIKDYQNSHYLEAYKSIRCDYISQRIYVHLTAAEQDEVYISANPSRQARVSETRL